MGQTIVVALPEAPPSLYLAWMAYWRDIERIMLEHPHLESIAAAESSPFVREQVADYLSAVVVRQIVEQGTEAERRGHASVAPRVEVDADTLRAGLEYVARRVAWLSAAGVHQALGIRPPGPAVADLRLRVLRSVRDQLG